MGYACNADLGRIHRGTGVPHVHLPHGRRTLFVTEERHKPLTHVRDTRATKGIYTARICLAFRNTTYLAITGVAEIACIASPYICSCG